MVRRDVRHRVGSGRCSRRGALLVDVLVATVLVAVALAVMVGLGASALSAQREGERLATAAMLLDEQLNLVLMRGADAYSTRFPMEGTFDAPFEKYRYRLEISGGDGGDAYVVVATVTWNDGGRQRQESIETRIAPRLGDEPDPVRRPAETVERDP